MAVMTSVHGDSVVTAVTAFICSGTILSLCTLVITAVSSLRQMFPDPYSLQTDKTF